MHDLFLWELGGSEWILQVSGDNGEVWGGYGGRARLVVLATTRGCSGFDPAVPGARILFGDEAHR